MAVTVDAEPKRHPVLRTGERDPIDSYKRMLIYERDGRSCQWCGAAGALQLDHIIPWSANGSDRSDNLRTLCQECNEDRSNFVDAAPPRIVGVTRACFWCAVRKGWVANEYDPSERVKAFCGACSTTSWVPDRSWIL